MKYSRLLLCCLLLAMLAAAPAWAKTSGKAAESVIVEECLPEAYLDSDDAFEGYFQQLLGMGSADAFFTPRNLGGGLSGYNKLIYDRAKAMIADVAAGNRASTVFEITVEELGLTEQYTASQLGVSSIFASKDVLSEDAKTALLNKIKSSFNLSTLTRALLFDCPYELYWHDKTTSTRLTYPTLVGVSGKDGAPDVIYFRGALALRYPVASEYAGSGDYTFNTKLAATAATAAANAKAIVRKYAASSDLEKLTAYKDRICALASYNNAAAKDQVVFGNPWQLIWVFDGDTSTKVVCEGYAKAFQYLCDMTEFDDDSICCYSVIGYLTAPSSVAQGGHMWNIVHMPNGKNYLADITNCDSGSVGAPDKLFLRGYDSGSVSTGYVFNPGSTVSYTYKPEALAMFTTKDLTLSSTSFLEEVIAIDASNFPDAIFRSTVAELYDANRDGYLYPEEISEVTSIDVSGMEIASLKGIEVFESLETLNCSNNKLTAVDLSGNISLYKLLCAANPLKTLDLSDCDALAELVVAKNRVSGDSVKHYKSGKVELSCDYGVRLTGVTLQNVLTLPGAMTDIGEEAFAGIAAEAVILPDGTGAIGVRAFADCPNLMEVTIPASVTDIDEDAFSGSPDVFIISPSAEIRKWATDRGIYSAKK